MSSPAQPQQPGKRKAIPFDEAMTGKREDGRLSLQPGINPFFITDVVFSEETKYNKDPVTGKGKIAKINGLWDIDKPTDQANTAKFYTAASALVNQLEKLSANHANGDGHFRVPVGPVTVTTQLAADGKSEYYKLVSAQPAA